MAASLDESLISRSTIPLYDPICMLDINRHVASGYLILLLGGPETVPVQQKTTRRRSKRDRSTTTQSSTDPEVDDGVVTLAFLSLTDGNVLNACFGAPTQLCDASSPSYNMAQNAKRELINASDVSDSVRQLAVQSYAAGFRIVVDYNDQLANMNACNRCWKQAELHKRAEHDLEVAFRNLSDVVSANS